MNIIEAWKAAKVGQEIRRKKGCPYLIKTHDSQEIDSRVVNLTNVLADDWEVVKTPKKYELSYGALVGNFRSPLTKSEKETIPDAAKVTIEWEE